MFDVALTSLRQRYTLSRDFKVPRKEIFKMNGINLDTTNKSKLKIKRKLIVMMLT